MLHIHQNVQPEVEFDYQNLPLEKRIVIQQSAAEIKKRIRQTARTIWEIGQKLVEVRSQLESRQFNSWLKLEFSWSRRTAYNFINVYEAFPECANFAQMEISISALYLLAAPSTPLQIRHQFLNRAIAGEQMSYKAIQMAIQEVKLQPADSATAAIRESDIYVHSEVKNPRLENTVQVNYEVPKIANLRADLYEPTAKTSSEKGLGAKPASSATTIASGDLRPGWNLIKREFLLFWGDTASPRFIERLPEEAFVLAVPSSQWHHEWLLSRYRNLIVLHQPVIEEEIVENLLTAFSQCHKAVILPWLPSWKTIALALKLSMKIYAGDPDLKRCEKVILKLGLQVARVNL